MTEVDLVYPSLDRGRIRQLQRGFPHYLFHPRLTPCVRAALVRRCDRLEFAAAVLFGRKNSHPGGVVWVYAMTEILLDKILSS